MRITYSTTKQKSPAEAEVVDRLVGTGIPENAVDMAVALMRSGRSDLLARVIAGELGLARALHIARAR
jgi:hypothetical protein